LPDQFVSAPTPLTVFRHHI